MYSIILQFWQERRDSNPRRMVLETSIIAAIRRSYGRREGTRTPIGGFGDRSPIQLDDSPKNSRRCLIQINEGQDQGYHGYLGHSYHEATLHHDLRGIEPRFSGCIMGDALPLSYAPHGGATGLEPATFSLNQSPVSYRLNDGSLGAFCLTGRLLHAIIRWDSNPHFPG